MDMSKGMGKLAFLPAAVGFLLGIFFLLAMDRLIPHLHLGESKPRQQMAAQTIAVADVVVAAEFVSQNIVFHQRGGDVDEIIAVFVAVIQQQVVVFADAAVVQLLVAVEVFHHVCIGKNDNLDVRGLII